jgi:hypothetical protein
MPINVDSARTALQDAFMGRTLALVRDGLTQTSVCGLSPRSGSTQRGDAADVERGEYRLTLPATSTLVLITGETVTIDARRFRVVWAPAASNLGLTTQYGVTEVR